MTLFLRVLWSGVPARALWSGFPGLEPIVTTERAVAAATSPPPFRRHPTRNCLESHERASGTRIEVRAGMASGRKSSGWSFLDGPKGSRPQYVVPGQVILADRVSLEHRFMLRPDPQMVALFFYLLGHFAAVHGIRIHAVVLMSTHYHLLFTDVRGCRGDFFRDFHAMLTKAVQVYRNTDAPLFIGSALTRGPIVSRNRSASRTASASPRTIPLQTDKRQTSQVEMLTATACAEAMAYVILNPTDAGITEDSTQWPGLFSRVEDAGVRRVQRFDKPKVIRREDGSTARFFDERWPEFVDLVQEPLCEAIGSDPDACVAKVRKELERGLAEKREEQAKNGWTFVGVLHALHQRVTKKAASSYLPRRLRNQGKIRPRLKAGRGERHALVQGILRNAGFFEAHGDCVARIRRGEQGVVFPAGTYRWHRVFGFPRVEATAGFYAMTNAFG